jgi:CDP-diacylglycerol--glycerol-3-phosphate 3-phosphatidyltransferase
MFDGRWRSSFEAGLKPVGANLRRTGITADHLTASGVVLAAAASVAIASGALRAGLLLLVLCALPDLLDGAVAKASGTAGPRGAFFDSVADRATDALLLGGIAWHLSTTHPGRIAVLPMAVLGASMLISYERAKAESLGFDARGGLMERAERIIALGVGLLFDSILIPILWAMLIATALTAVQRFIKVWRQASVARPAPEPTRWRARRAARPTERAWRRRARTTRR